MTDLTDHVSTDEKVETQQFEQVSQEISGLPNEEKEKQFSQFVHDRFYHSLQYVQFLTQRAEQAIQTYLTIFTASLGGLVVLLSSSQWQISEFFGVVAIVILMIGTIGVITTIRLTAYRNMRDRELNRLHEIQKYFREINPAAFDKHQIGILPKGEVAKYWYTPLLWGFGIFHAILPGISVSIMVSIVVSSLGYSINLHIWWIVLLGIILCSSSAIVFNRVHSTQI
jgi:hypothetical protein